MASTTLRLVAGIEISEPTLSCKQIQSYFRVLRARTFFFVLLSHIFSTCLNSTPTPHRGVCCQPCEAAIIRMVFACFAHILLVELAFSRTSSGILLDHHIHNSCWGVVRRADATGMMSYQETRISCPLDIHGVILSP